MKQNPETLKQKQERTKKSQAKIFEVPSSWWRFMNEFMRSSFDLSARRESSGQRRSSRERDKEQRDNCAYEAGERQQVRI